MTSNTINDAQTIAGNGEGTLLANRYRVVRKLGLGGMGSVWLAEDIQLDNKPFAIKMLPAILVANKRAYRQLKEEALVAMRLVHPNIVQIRAFEENNGNPFLVMDYVDGRTLDDYLAEKGILSEEEAVKILRPVAAALDYAHGEGVVHRDVKPANVMIRVDGHPFILDFGIAREIQETLTRVTGKLSSGTLLYMSPEQLNGEPPKKAQDVYSFAAMAYECLKGEPPFVRGQIEHQILNTPPSPLPGGSRSCAAAVMAGLSKKPECRPPTCVAVLAARIVCHAPPSEGPRVSRPRVQEVCSRPALKERKEGGEWKILFAVVVLGLAVGGGGLWHYRQGQKREQAALREQAAMEESRRRAEEDVRRKVEEAKRKAEEEARQQAVAEEANRKRATEIRIEAKVRKEKVERIADADGFKDQKARAAETFARAETLFDEKTRRWAEAAREFSSYVEQCESLIRLDDERQRAVISRTRTQEAFRSAEAAGAKTYAVTRWNAAVEIWNRAAAEFGRMEFLAAGDTFASAAEQFGMCIDEAKDERERQKAAAKVKAEEAIREQKRRAKWRRAGEQFTINDPYGLDLTMKWCPAGSFVMGSPATEEGRADNEVQHQVTLTKGFWMGETEVTQGQWKMLMDGETVADLARKALTDDAEYKVNGTQQTIRAIHKVKSDDANVMGCHSGDMIDQVPVYWVSWHDAVRFCHRLTQRERAAGRMPDGYEYRLPTEAEWEYACRAGTTTALPNGKDIHILDTYTAPALDDIAWHGGNSKLGKGERRGTLWGRKVSEGTILVFVPQRVKGKRANSWGLYDMIGNMCEWCGDWASYYESGSSIDPTGPASGQARIVRGGNWQNGVRFCRPAHRSWIAPGYRDSILSFRIALAPVLNR